MSKTGIKVTVDGNVSKVFKALLKQWPSLEYDMLSEIGYVGRRSLYENYLRGQVIMLKPGNYGRDGKRRKVAYYLGKRQKNVKIIAYPVNLFDPRNVYASAKPTVEQAIKSSLKDYERRVLAGRIRKIDGGKS